jgi:SAM-dependent methyltransferase
MARDHPWGGCGIFDRVRSALTVRSLERLLPRGTPLRILEIGMGRGLVLSHFMGGGHETWGIDPGALEREVVPSLRSGATIFARAVEEVDLPEGAFDLVYGIHVVEHLRDPALVFRTCHRALRPGGILYLITPNGASDGLRLFGERWWNLEDPTHVRFFSPRSISIMLSRAGFQRARIRNPIWDSLSIEISSLVRTIRPSGREHGVLDNRAMLPVYAVLSPAALGVRAVWPRLSPSMEVVAAKEPTPSPP